MLLWGFVSSIRWTIHLWCIYSAMGHWLTASLVSQILSSFTICGFVQKWGLALNLNTKKMMIDHWIGITIFFGKLWIGGWLINNEDLSLPSVFAKERAECNCSDWSREAWTRLILGWSSQFVSGYSESAEVSFLQLKDDTNHSFIVPQLGISTLQWFKLYFLPIFDGHTVGITNRWRSH